MMMIMNLLNTKKNAVTMLFEDGNSINICVFVVHIVDVSLTSWLI
jgi:hypothetical protein